MIPYFQFTSFQLGPVTIQVWGLMVALGIIAAILLTRALTKKYVLSEEVMIDMALWAIVSAFLFARVFHVVFYNLDYYLANPEEIPQFWHGGASSLGGFFGAFVALYLFTKVRRFSWKEIVPYFDIAAVGLWLGWGIGRIGCFLIHDHPGTLSHFVGAVQYPPLVTGAPHERWESFLPMPRYDLGLYESLVGFVLFAIFFVLFPRLIKKQWGLVAELSVLSYAVIRFFLDFLRATDLTGSDIRYGYLTPAQWGMLALVCALTTSIVYGRMGRVKNANLDGSKQTTVHRQQ